MKDENIIKMWVVIGLALILVVGIICTSVVLNNKIAFENGYEKVMLVGDHLSEWQKVR